MSSCSQSLPLSMAVMIMMMSTNKQTHKQTNKTFHARLTSINVILFSILFPRINMTVLVFCSQSLALSMAVMINWWWCCCILVSSDNQTKTKTLAMVVNMMTNKQTNTQNFPCMAVMMKTMPHSCYFLNQSFLDEIMMEAFSSVNLFLWLEDS